MQHALLYGLTVQYTRTVSLYHTLLWDGSRVSGRAVTGVRVEEWIAIPPPLWRVTGRQFWLKMVPRSERSEGSG